MESVIKNTIIPMVDLKESKNNSEGVRAKRPSDYI